MKILHIIPNLKRGGAERICIDICNEQVNQGHQAIIVTFEEGNDYKELSNHIHFIPAYFSPSLIGKNKLEIKELEYFVNKFQPDIIHSHLYAADLIAFQIKTESTVKFISHLHSKRKELDSSFKPEGIKTRLIQNWEKKMYLRLLQKKQVTSIAISKDVYEYAIKDLKQENNRCVLLENCISFNIFKSKSKQLSKPVNLISVGSFNSNKSQDFLIDCLNYLPQNDFKLTFIGTGPKLEKCKNLVREKGLSTSVEFLGQQNNPEIYLRNSHIFVHAAKSEAFGLALLEAMAAGLPVITTDGRGNRDIINEGKNGFMVWDRNPEKFTHKIINLVTSPNKYEEMSKYAIDYAEKFDVQPYCKKLISIYTS